MRSLTTLFPILACGRTLVSCVYIILYDSDQRWLHSLPTSHSPFWTRPMIPTSRDSAPCHAHNILVLTVDQAIQRSVHATLHASSVRLVHPRVHIKVGPLLCLCRSASLSILRYYWYLSSIETRASCHSPGALKALSSV